MGTKTQATLQFIESIRVTSDMDEIIDSFFKMTKTIVTYQGCGLYLLNEGNNSFDKKRIVDFSEEIEQEIQVMIDEGIIDWVIEGGEVRIIPAKVFEKQGKNTSSERANFIITPLLVGKRVIGIFLILAPLPEKEVNPTKLNTLFLLANQTASAIEHALLYQDMKRRIRDLQVLFETGRSMSKTVELDHLLLLILNMATEVIKTDYSILFLTDSDDVLIPSKATGIQEELLQGVKIKPGDGISGWVVKQKQPLVIQEYKNDVRFNHCINLLPFTVSNALSAPLLAKGKAVGVLTLYNSKDSKEFSDDDFRMLTALASHAGIAIERSSLYERLQKGYFETITALANAIEAKDPYTRGHAIRVTTYAIGIAKAMNLSQKEIDIIRYAAILHDIGKIGIPGAILRKPTKLTPKEFKTIQGHPTLGEEIIKSVTFLKDAAPLIRHHHEYMDGKGYPDKLLGENIPLGARILTVADAFDAMTTDRPYRKAMSQEIAIGELQRFSSRQFDFEVVTSMQDVLLTGMLKSSDDLTFHMVDMLNKNSTSLLDSRD